LPMTSFNICGEILLGSPSCHSAPRPFNLYITAL